MGNNLNSPKVTELHDDSPNKKNEAIIDPRWQF